MRDEIDFFLQLAIEFFDKTNTLALASNVELVKRNRFKIKINNDLTLIRVMGGRWRAPRSWNDNFWIRHDVIAMQTVQDARIPNGLII